MTGRMAGWLTAEREREIFDIRKLDLNARTKTNAAGALLGI